MQIAREPKQQLGLALYREGLGSDEGFYQFLSFYKVVNIVREQIPQQIAWINQNLGEIWDYRAKDRLIALQVQHSDVGAYLSAQGRNAIAHAYSQPVRDPDSPEDIYAVRTNIPLIRGLAQVAIEKELKIPSMRKIWNEHLYELAGFRDILGKNLSQRLERGLPVPSSDFPALPEFSIRLRAHNQLHGLASLQMKVISSQGGIVTIGTCPLGSPVQVHLLLNFPQRTLELLLPSLSIAKDHPAYTKELEADIWRFLQGFYGNGELEIYDNRGTRLSLKLAFIPVNIDPSRTIENFQRRIDDLLGSSNEPESN